jgi:hypothetical protein
VVDLPDPKLDDWQRVRGNVRSGLATSSKNSTPEEYRELVKNYFKEIARRSSADTSAQQ